MQFGLFYEWPNPELRNWKTLYGEGVEEIQYSEEMGFDYCLIAEHHFSNYGNSPAPLLQALHIGQQTKRLRDLFQFAAVGRSREVWEVSSLQENAVGCLPSSCGCLGRWRPNL